MSEQLTIKRLTAISVASAANLQRLRKLLWSVLSFSPADDRISSQKSVCVSLERSGVSLAYGTRFLSRIRIRGFKRHSFEGQGYPHPEDFAAAVALTVNDLRSGRTEITLSIPKAWAIITTGELPSVVRENLSEVVSYELDRLTPLSAEEAYYDFRILKEGDGKLTVLLAVARIDILNPYLEALREKGLKVKRITVNLSAVGTLCTYTDGGDDSIFIELGKDGYEGALFLDRSITKTFTNGFTTSDERARADMLLSEIEVLRATVTAEGKDSSVFLLLGDTSPAFAELLKLHATFPLKVLYEADIGLRLPGAQKDLSYASAGGILEALWPKSRGLNLLEKGLHEKAQQPVGITLVLIVAILALWTLYLITPYQIESKRVSEIDRQITLKRSEVKKVEALKKDIDALNSEVATIDHFKENRPMTLNLLKELTTILPKTTWLTRLRATDTTVEIEGYASSATEMLPKLEASKNFRKAEFASPTFRDARMNADRFVIKMDIEGVKKPEEGIKKPEGEAVKHGKK